jgi:hypothetical protein
MNRNEAPQIAPSATSSIGVSQEFTAADDEERLGALAEAGSGLDMQRLGIGAGAAIVPGGAAAEVPGCKLATPGSGRWFLQSACPRSETHVRSAPSRSRSVVRRSPRPSRPQEQSDHHALLLSRAHGPDSGSGKGLRQRVPHFPRSHLVTATSGTRDPRQDVVAVREIGAPGEIRTPDHLVRSQVLYPAELRARGSKLRGAIIAEAVSGSRTKITPFKPTSCMQPRHGK